MQDNRVYNWEWMNVTGKDGMARKDEKKMKSTFGNEMLCGDGTTYRTT